MGAGAQDDAASRVEREVAALSSMGLQELREAWRSRYGPPPKLRSVELLRLSLAWRMQAQVFGGLDEATRRKLRRSAGAGDTADRLEVGTRITREWQGSSYRVEVVEVVEGGYAYEGRTYKSLSQVAREITGTRWNGPRFFGMRAEPARKAAA